MNHDNLHPESLVIHGGQSPEPTTGAVMPPVSLASTYAQPSPGEHLGYEYTRSHNPTRYAFERCVALLENSGIRENQDPSFGGFAFASGMATMATILELCNSGDHIIAMDDIYGGSRRLLSNVRIRSMGIEVTFVDMTDLDQLRGSMQDETRLIWIETPTNPLLKIVDLKAVAEIAKNAKTDRRVIVACDNTFATPLIQRPLDLGCDIAMHSVSKYINGHSDVIGGVAVTNDLELCEELRYLQNAIGSVMPPFDAYMTLRGLKTLGVRMRQHSQSAMTIAKWLEEQPQVERVTYPALPSHPQHDLAARQMQLDGQPAAGGMITMFLKGGLEESRTFLEKVEMFTLAESLGGVESLIEHPAIMTHASVPDEARAELGITDNLIRLSVGIEHIDDLIGDIERALHAAVPSVARA